MSHPVCLLNIGNTHVRIALADGQNITTLRSVETHNFTPDLIPDSLPVAAASVVPRITELLNRERPGVFLVTKDSSGVPDLSDAEAEKLGADRIANTAQLLAGGLLPAMTIDCGTAVNCEIVDQSGRYAGGAIFPGRILIRKSLNLFTAQLPEIPLFEDLPPFPGKSTLGDLRWGTDGLLLAGLASFTAQARKFFAPNQLRIVVCGGDRAFPLAHIPGLKDGGDFFTLRGILTLYRKSFPA